MWMYVYCMNVCWWVNTHIFVLVYVCVYTRSPPCILGELPLAKRKAKNKVTGSQKERMRDAPEAWNPDIPFLLLGTVPPGDSKDKMIDLPPHPPFPTCSTLFPSERSATESETKPPETERLRKGVKRQFAGMPKWESDSKQNVLLINKKLSLNNAARSPLTPLDLRFASASSQSGGNWAVSPSLSQAPWRAWADTCNIYILCFLALTSSVYSLI